MSRNKFDPVTIDLIGEDKESFDAASLLNLLETQKHDVKKVRFAPPQLGDRSFGEFVVTWKTKKYRKIAHVG